jgi:hypothetical protein
MDDELGQITCVTEGLFGLIPDFLSDKEGHYRGQRKFAVSDQEVEFLQRHLQIIVYQGFYGNCTITTGFGVRAVELIRHLWALAFGQTTHSIDDPGHPYRVLPTVFFQLPPNALPFFLADINNRHPQEFLAGHSTILDRQLIVPATGQCR